MSPAKPAKSPTKWMTPTQWIDRFKEALALLCGEAPPMGMAEAWVAHESEALQDWVACKTPLRWAQGIAVIDAATTIADQPEEGMGHLPLNRR